MKIPITECSREPEVLEVITAGQWAEDAVETEAGVELREHARDCEVCCDLLAVAGAIHGEHTSELRMVSPPPASLVWWRSELQARRDATKTAARPITVVHALTIACAVGVLLGAGRPLLPTLDRWFVNFTTLIADFGPAIQYDTGLLSSTGLPLFPIMLAALTCGFLLVPVAIYLILSDK